MHFEPCAEETQQPYLWPDSALDTRFDRAAFDGLFRTAPLRETAAGVAADSRWPAFFPSPIGLITTGTGSDVALERVVGPMIVNRFPLVMAVSLCRTELSERHYARRTTMARLEESGVAALQFVAPGAALSRLLDAIADLPDARTTGRVASAGASTRRAATSDTRVLEDAYLVYEGRLVRPGVSFDGHHIYERPWIDVGSHRVYFLEVLAIQLESTIAAGQRQIAWHSLPNWTPEVQPNAPAFDGTRLASQRYVKVFTPNYRFPSAGTVAFEADDHAGGMAIRHLEPLPAGQVVVDNDRARWPCFFPSSAGMLTAWMDDGTPTAMPCGSSGIVSRLPLVVAACLSNSAINERYAPRATLGIVRAAGRFGVGVPFAGDEVVRAIGYLGNISARDDRDKVAHAGLMALGGGPSPVVAQLPIHFEARVVREVELGTHVMVLGEVEHIHVRRDLTPARPLEWTPWAALA